MANHHSRALRHKIAVAFLESGIKDAETLACLIDLFFKIIATGKGVTGGEYMAAAYAEGEPDFLDSRIRREVRYDLFARWLKLGARSIEELEHLILRFDNHIAKGVDDFPKYVESSCQQPFVQWEDCNSESGWLVIRQNEPDAKTH